jgi:AcrR family transcriptional regulator
MIETQEKILATAERLFGEQGYAATSLRHIIAEAGVNLAAIHYHFGSKEDLLDQLVMRRAAPVNTERLAMLDRLEAEPGGPPSVEKVLEAFLEPPFRRISEFPDLIKLMGRLYGEGLMTVIGEKHFHNVAIRFLAALGRALPHLSQAELRLRGQLVLGAMSHTMFYVPVSGSKASVDGAVLLRELIVFLSGGLRAPAVLPERIEEK